MAACAITVDPYVVPLGLQAPDAFNWWLCSEGELATWSEPWVLSISLKLPEPRMHYDHPHVDTLAGPLWARNLASEGFKLSLGLIELTVGTAKEHIFNDYTVNGFELAPEFGRQLSLKTRFFPAPNSLLSKSIYIGTAQSGTATEVVSLRYTPPSDTVAAFVELFWNGVFLMKSPVEILGYFTGLVLSQFEFTVEKISDSQGELNLNQQWTNDGSTEPVYTVVPHPGTSGYPTNYIGYSPTIYFIEIKRNNSVLPTTIGISSESNLIGAPWVKIESENHVPYGAIQIQKNTIAYLIVTAISSNGNTVATSAGQCDVWWDLSSGESHKLGSGNMTNGVLSIAVTPTMTGFGWLRIINKAYNNLGATYYQKNPIPMVVTEGLLLQAPKPQSSPKTPKRKR